jgi:hypothetical protein
MPLQLESAVDVGRHSGDERWLLIERILATEAFKRSPRLSAFLRYVTQMTLLENDAQLSEQRVGAAIFGRAEDYDCSADTVVRSSALRLRRQLELYFQREGSAEPIGLTLPRGSYRVAFEQRTLPDAHRLAEPKPLLIEPQVVGEVLSGATPVVASPEYDWWRRFVVPALLLFCVALSVECFLLMRRLPSHVPQSDSSLWPLLFTPNHPTRIVLGDSGLVIFHAVTHRYFSLADYVAHRYQLPAETRGTNDPEFAKFLAQRRYTSVVDADALVRLSRLPEATPDRTQVQFARDLRLENLKDGNLILLGSQEADPWVELFERSMDFQFHGPVEGAASHFSDRHAPPGKSQSYSTEGGRVFAVIALLPNLSNSGNVLLLEGLNMTGTESALDFVLEKDRIEPLLKKLVRPDGTLPYFEILLECTTVTDNATPASVVQVRVHPI